MLEEPYKSRTSQTLSTYCVKLTKLQHDFFVSFIAFLCRFIAFW